MTSPDTALRHRADPVSIVAAAATPGLAPSGVAARARRWARLQAASGLVFGVFAALHLLNVALAALGPGVFDGFQGALQPYYQHRLVEVPVLLFALVVHVVSGLARMRMRRGQRAPRAPRARLHRHAGYFLLAFIGGHVAATRLPAVLHGAPPGFAGIAFSFQLLPQWFYVYYPLLGLAGLAHLVIGAPLALGVLGLRAPSRALRGARLWLPTGLLAAFVLVGLAGLGGLLYPVADQSAHPFARVLSAWSAGRSFAP